ncbi:MAG: type I-C CRISPR-associated protein Cas8c/Csd1 [Christensenella sp.]
MIISELCNYYDVLAGDEKSNISPYGFESVKANLLATLTEEGELYDIVPLGENNGGSPVRFVVPKTMKVSGIAASPVLDNTAYIFGISVNKGTKNIEEKKFLTAKELHIRLFGEAQCVQARAIVAFFEKWDLQKAWENENLLKLYTDNGKLLSGNVAFRLKGETQYLHEVPEICDIWLAENQRKLDNKGSRKRQCSVTGEMQEIAQLHNQLTGVKGANATGASLISFKQDAHRSYNIEKSYGAAVSQRVMFEYTTALQYLLNSKNQKLYFGEDTVVFWAHTRSRRVEELLGMLFMCKEESKDSDNTESIENKQMQQMVYTLLEEGKKGIPVVQSNDELRELDAQATFCCLGLAPNAARISVRYFYKDNVGDFVEKIKQHQDDIKICGGRKLISNSSLLYATLSEKSKDKKVNPLLGGAIMRAVLSGEMYPQMMLQQIIMRVKAEQSVTQSRAASIKGYLVRKARINNKEEEITVALNKESTNEAYLLGRVFAILERIQRDALGDNVNATIKDKFFSTACANPVRVFPNLIKLCQHHITKAKSNNKFGNMYYMERALQECMGNLPVDSFPASQNMEAQGRFILGYYQQVQSIYEPKNKTEQ